MNSFDSLFADWINLPAQAFISGNHFGHPFLEGRFRHVDDLEVYNRLLFERIVEVRYYFDSARWKEFLSCFSREHRPEAALRLYAVLNDEMFLSLIGDVWNDPANHQMSSSIILSAIFHIREPALRYSLMNESELLQFNRLPEVVQAYRSHIECNAAGPIWVLDKDTAMEYAYIFKWPLLSSAKLKRNDIVALFDRKRFKELVVDCSDINQIATEEIPFQYLERIAESPESTAGDGP